MGAARKLLIALNTEENRRVMSGKVLVDARALREVLDDYEKSESFARAQSVLQIGYFSQEHAVSEILRSLYARRGGNADSVMLLIMNILRPLIEERERGRLLDGLYNR